MPLTFLAAILLGVLFLPLTSCETPRDAGGEGTALGQGGGREEVPWRGPYRDSRYLDGRTYQGPATYPGQMAPYAY